MVMTRLWLPGCLLGLTLLTGCVGSGELQALRADIAALERDRSQRAREVSTRLESLDARVSKPELGGRRELAQTAAAADELRVELQRLNGTVEELQYRMQSGSGPNAEAQTIIATRLAELETRLAALEQRVDPDRQVAFKPSREARPIAAAPEPGRTPPPPATSPLPTRQPLTRDPAPTSPPAASDSASEGLYQRALKEYKAGNHEVAIVLFKQLLRQHPEASIAGHAQYWLGESLYAQQQYEAAIVAFDEVVQKYADDSKVPAAILKQGYAFAALDDVRNARFFLQQVQRKYPDSKEAEQASKRLDELKP